MFGCRNSQEKQGLHNFSNSLLLVVVIVWADYLGSALDVTALPVRGGYSTHSSRPVLDERSSLVSTTLNVLPGGKS